MDAFFEETRTFWNQEIVRGNLKWPDTEIIRFVKHYVPASGTVLDFGCGAGRNTMALAAEGYRCIAMDYTKEAVKIVQKKAEEQKYDVCVVQNSALEVPLPENSVDAVFADGSLFFNRREEIEELLSNLKNCMKKNGLIWADFRSKKDYLFGKGEKIADGLYRLDAQTDRESCAYFFADEDTLRKMYENAGLSVVSVDTFEYTENDGARINSWYHIIAKK